MCVRLGRMAVIKLDTASRVDQLSFPPSPFQVTGAAGPRAGNQGNRIAGGPNPMKGA